MVEVVVKTYRQGDTVKVRAYHDEILTRRVWRDADRGILLCSERDYQRFLVNGSDPRWVGFPKEDVVD